MNNFFRAAKGFLAATKRSPQKNHDTFSVHEILNALRKQQLPPLENTQVKLQEKNVAYLNQALIFFKEDFGVDEDQYQELCWRFARQLTTLLIHLKGCILTIGDEYGSYDLVLKKLRDLGPRVTYEITVGDYIFVSSVEKNLLPKRGMDKLVPHWI